jgi:hypothetical protein
LFLVGSLLDAYRRRPPDEQNDYIGWIMRAKRADTQRRRVAQMLDELERGDVSMKMSWNPKRRECLHLCRLSPVVLRQGRHG